MRACSPLRVRACGEDTGVKKKGTKEKKSDREGTLVETRRGQQGRWVGGSEQATKKHEYKEKDEEKEGGDRRKS